MNEENQVYFVDSDKLPEEALKRKHRLEQDPTFRTNHMEYMEGMEVIQSDIKDKVEAAMKAFDYDAYTASDVERALSHETCSIEDFKALLSPAASTLSGSHGKKGRGDHEKPFWEYCIYFYSYLHCQLLPELLYLLRF